MAWRAPSASEFRDRVTVERNTRISDQMGGFTDAWGAFVTNTAAKIALVRGGEETRAKRLGGVGQFDVTLRANTLTKTITSADRLVNVRTGDTFNILWAGSFDDRQRFVVLTCEQGGPQDG